ncbi:hypothetical protein NRS6110_04277 [Bacillus subtilis]|uniref:hypothetical protein n=1 Tax=Bacillus subtilis group TaxID=653685 RepID=UPI0011AA67A6|nr:MULTISPECIES: hypothetical protein [Bacillus subtilis group]CAF1783340.1 hypothetical protein NRS6116_03964 [Bacillus subtilis]CAF1786672.1 hypothetical protein NRS6110_04277 [Bacillus subtilis]CAI6331375.1 hypothetical protein NRS6116_22845 [Bacillus subtilis]
MIKTLLLGAVALAFLTLLIVFVLNLNKSLKPASKRLKGQRKRSQANLGELDEKLLGSLERIIPKSLRLKINKFIMGSGQEKDWPSEKLVLLSVLFFLIGCLFTILITILSKAIVFLILGIPLAILLGSLPSLYILSSKKQHITRLVFSAGDFIDVLQKEIVYGSGSPQIALEKAKDESSGALRTILIEVNKQLEKDKGNYHQALTYLEKSAPHPLYKDVVLVLNTGYESGRFEKMFRSLQRSCKSTISEYIRKQTAARGLTITGVALILVMNMLILLMYPMLVTLLDRVQNISL